MSCGSLMPAMLFLATLASIPETVLTGRLSARDTGLWLGGGDAYVVAFAESAGGSEEVVILGYAHPDNNGRWTIPALPSTGLIHVAGFHRGFPAILFYAEVALTGNPNMDLGIQQAGADAAGAGTSTRDKAPGVARLLAKRQNPEIAAELMRLISAKEKSGRTAAAEAAGDTKPIEGLWSRNGRTYRIEGDQATIEDAGPSAKAAVTAGLVVMRNIVKAGAFVWKAEVLWQLDSERKWAPGTLTLSPDGNTLTRESTSPWNKVPETVVLQKR